MQSHSGLNLNCAKIHNPEKNNNQNSTTTIVTATTIMAQQQRQQQEEWKEEGRRKRKGRKRAEEVKVTGTRTHILQRQPHVLDGLKVADLTAVDELCGQHSLLEGTLKHY